MLLHEPEAQERMRRVRVLLESQNDYVIRAPQALKGSRGSDVDGPAAASWVPCDAEGCQYGRVRFGGLFYKCKPCNGTGRRPKRKDDIAWDAHVDAPLEEALAPRLSSGTPNPQDRDRRIGQVITRLEREIDALWGFDSQGDEEAWVTDQGWLERDGSYSELRRALECLRWKYPRLRAAVRAKYESELDVETSELVHARAEAGVRWLAHKMRGDIRLPRAYEEEVRSEHNRTVEQCIALGWKTGRIARELNVTHNKVRQIRRSIAA